MSDPRVADRYMATLARLSGRSSSALLRIWDALGSWTEADGDRFRAQGLPIVHSTALAAVKAAYAYATTIEPNPPPVSPLIIPDALARLYDPFDRIGSMLANGRSWEDAVASGRSMAGSLGTDTVYRTSRQAIAETVKATEWQRRVSAGSCDWCVKLSRVVWPTAEAATFGHTNCDCVPLPKAVVSAHNDRVFDAHEFAQTAEEKARHDQAASLRKQIDTAKARQAAAKAEQTTETDPVRLERLSVREQEWETRAERAEEQLRILTTGTHRRAA